MLVLDCTSSGRKTCQKFGVSGLPTFKFFSGGAYNEPEEYNGGRGSKDFLAYINNVAGDHDQGQRQACGGWLTSNAQL